jgi:hypothetical protein
MAIKENSIEEDITRVKQRIEDVKEYIEYGLPYSEYLDLENSFDNILSAYKRVLKENEELNKNYNSLIDKIILKIDEYDYKFEKAKKQNKNDIADYYWDLIINFKKLLGGE